MPQCTPTVLNKQHAELFHTDRETRIAWQWNNYSGSSKVIHLEINEKPSRDCNIVCKSCIHILDILCKVSEHIASNKRWKLRSSKPHSRLNIGSLKTLGRLRIRSRSLFSKNINGFLLGWTLKAKFEVRSFTRSWDNRRYFKTLGSPWIRHLLQKILMDFRSDQAYECTGQIWSP